MSHRIRTSMGILGGFLVPLGWILFHRFFFDDTTIVTHAFERRAGLADSLMLGLAGWLVGGLFSGGVTLDRLARLATTPDKTLEPPLARLFASGPWLGAVLLLLAAEGWVVSRYLPIALPELPGGLVWVYEKQAIVESDRSMEPKAMRYVFAVPAPTDPDVLLRPESAVARVDLPGGRWPNATIQWTQFRLNEVEGRCGSEVQAGAIPFDRLWQLGCLGALRADLAKAILDQSNRTLTVGNVAVQYRPGSPATLTFSRPGYVTREELAPLVGSWLGLAFNEAQEPDLIRTTAETLQGRGLDLDLFRSALRDLLPEGPAWATLPAEVKAGRLSALFRLVYGCEGCDPARRNALLGETVAWVRPRFVQLASTGKVKLTDSALASRWSEISVWWANRQGSTGALASGLRGAHLCGAEVNRIFVDQVEPALLEALGTDRGSAKSFAESLILYTRKSEAYCSAAKRRVEDPELAQQAKELLLKWLREAVTQDAACPDLRSAVFPS